MGGIRELTIVFFFNPGIWIANVIRQSCVFGFTVDVVVFYKALDGQFGKFLVNLILPN